MKYLILQGEPIPILDKSYVTNIQIECESKQEALDLISDYTEKDWTSFSISRGGNETAYEVYTLESVVIDFEQPVVHFILTDTPKPALTQVDYETEAYAQAAKILMGESL